MCCFVRKLLTVDILGVSFVSHFIVSFRMNVLVIGSASPFLANFSISGTLDSFAPNFCASGMSDIFIGFSIGILFTSFLFLYDMFIFVVVFKFCYDCSY